MTYEEKSLPKLLDGVRKAATAAQKSFDEGFQAGRRAGFDDARRVALNELEKVVMDPKLERGSEKYKAAIDITRHVSATVREAKLK